MQLFNSEDSSLRPGTTLFLRPLEGSLLAPGDTPFVIRKIRFGLKAICSLEGVEGRQQAEEITPCALLLRRSDFPQLAAGEFYLADLEGLQVRDSDGNPVGVVLHVYHNGAQPVLEVQWGQEQADIPFAPPFVLDYDLEANWIRLVRPAFD